MFLVTTARQLANASGIVPIDVPFPINGVDQSMPRSQQGNLTCTEALNVCGFPPFSDRHGGGKCEGSRRAWNFHFTSTVGNNRILGMSSLTVATGAVPAGTDTTDRMYPTSQETPSPSSPQCWFIDGTSPAATLWGSLDETPCDFAETFARAVPSNNAASPNTCELTLLMSAPAVAVPSATASVTLRFVYRVLTSGTGIGGAGGVHDSTDALNQTIIDVDIMAGSSPQAVAVNFDEIVAVPSGEWITISQPLTPAQISAITALSSAWNLVSARVRCRTAGTQLLDVIHFSQVEIAITDTVTPPSPPTGFTGKILVCNRGRCRVGILPADMGTATLPTEEVSSPDGGGYTLTNEVPSIAAFQGRWYVVDGTGSVIVTPSDIATGLGSEPDVVEWDTAISAGAFPANCRLACVYSGRIVLARQEGPTPNASIYYMSRVLDPLDWAFALDSAERPGETSAVAGTNEFLGQPADAITALIPFGDDYLIFGCSKSMWIMEGDPGSGGRVINLSRQTGVLDSRSWCFDETGTLWFMGSGGLYTYNPGEGLKNVSGRRLYRVLDRINASKVTVQLAYSAFRKEVMIFLTPINAPSTATAQRESYTVFENGMGTHIKYDIIRNAPFFRTLNWETMGPWSVLEIQGSTDDDRTYLIGGNDGYVRRPFEGGYIAGEQRYGTADDMNRNGGTTNDASGLRFPITSSFRSAPIEWPGGTNEIHAVEIQATGTDNNLPLGLPLGPVRWRVMAADSPARVTEKSQLLSADTGLWFSSSDYGFQDPVGLSVCDGALQVIVSQPNNSTQSWALDRITLFVRAGARRR